MTYKISQYPLYFRRLTIKHYNNINNKVVDTLTIFNISNGSLYNWIKKDKKGNLEPNYMRKSKFSPVCKCYIRTYVINHINFDYKKLIKLIKRKFNISISKSSIYNLLSKMKITRKKIRKKIAIKDPIKLNNEKAKFRKNIQNINQNLIISVDETSIDTHISANYGWSNSGKRIINVKIVSKIRYTITTAVSNKKVIYWSIVKGSSNKETFKKFLENVVSKFKTKRYILLDNARIHHAKTVKEYIQTTKCEFLFNVPYTPEYNPIEQVFSKFKSIIRKKEDNTKKELLLKNIKKAFQQITKKDLTGFFRNSLNFN